MTPLRLLSDIVLNISVQNKSVLRWDAPGLNKTNDLQHYHNANYKNQNMRSNPLKHRKIERKSSGSSLFKSPINKKQVKDKSLQSNDATQAISLNKKENFSISSDYDVFKSELENMENFQNFENIGLMHDLDSVTQFNNKVPDILFVSTDTNYTQEIDDSMMQTSINKDPLTDPLFINDHETQDIDVTFAKSKSRSPSQKVIQIQSSIQSSCSLNKQTETNNVSKFSINQESNLGKEEKDLLEELENVEEQKELSFTTIKKLQELQIKLIHKVPRQHQIELTGSHAPTKKIRKLFQTYGPLRKGPYSPREDKIIMKNWEMFCKLHNWDPKNVEPFFYWRYKGKYYIEKIEDRRKFVQFLANGLPWRTLYSVYTRFKVLYQNKIIHIRYTLEEDKKILMYIKNKHLEKRDTKYIELAKLLGRTRRSISKRYQRLKKEFEMKNKNESKAKQSQDVTWTLPLIKKFIKTLLSVTLSEDIEELKYAILPKPIWQKMEEKLNIDEKILKTFWQNQLHLQLFSTSPIYLNDIKIMLIEYMYIKGISHTREIIWPNVACYFDGATSQFLCKVFYYLVQECDMNDVDNFAEVIEYMYHEKIPEIQKMPTDKFLPRIIYKNEKINLLEEEEEEDNKNAIITNNESFDADNDIDDSDSDM